MALRLHLGVSRQNRWRGWCWFWVCEFWFWCANVYCHHGDGAAKMLCGPQSNVLVRERFSLWGGLGLPASVRTIFALGRLGFASLCANDFHFGRGGFGLWHSPLSSPEGPLQQCEKSSKSAFWHSLFFCTPSILSASKLATVCPGTKKALKRCLRAFFCCCGERGIRTPGTVTRTTV